jgi:hypothetical protein
VCYVTAGVTKGFGDPGSTQQQDALGHFTDGSGAAHAVGTTTRTVQDVIASHGNYTVDTNGDAVDPVSGLRVGKIDATSPQSLEALMSKDAQAVYSRQMATFGPTADVANNADRVQELLDKYDTGGQAQVQLGPPPAGRGALASTVGDTPNTYVMQLNSPTDDQSVIHEVAHVVAAEQTGYIGHGSSFLNTYQSMLAGEGYARNAALVGNFMSPTTKRFGDPRSTQEQDALGHFTDGTGVQGLWFARTSPYAKDFGDKGHFVPTASQKQLDAATAALAAHGMTVDDIMRLQQAALEKGEGVAQAAGISPEQTAAWYVTEQEMADAWVDHGYFPLQEAGMVAATTANVKFSETYANDTPNFAAGTTTYPNFTAAASCAAYVSDNPELPITEEDAERINAASTGYDLDTGKIGNTPSGLDEFGAVPIPGGQNAVVATVNDDGTPILDENGDPIVVHANDLSDQQLGKYISMAGNSLIPGVAVGYPNSIANGVAIARGADPTSVIQGNKESSFMSNFAYPTESDTTTMDSHMGAISLNANGDDVVPGTVVQGDDGKLTITPSQGGFLTNLPVVDTDGNPVIGGDGKPKTYNEVAAFLGKSGGYVTLNNITLQVAANNNMVGNNAQALMWISDTNPKDVQSMKAAKITNAVWLPPYLPDSDEEPDTDKLTATPPPLAMRCVVTSANVNHAPWRKAASKSFGSPGNTQSRVAHGEFGMAEGAPNQSSKDKALEDKAIAHFGAADELQGQQFITPNGTILDFEGDGHDRIKEVQQR